MSWKWVKLADLFAVGSSKRVLKSQWQTSGVPFYRGREITKLAIHGSVDNELFISEELYSELSQKHGAPVSGDIVITAIGTIGNAYIVKPEDRFYFKDASVLWLAKKSNIDSDFVNYWLQSSQFKTQLEKGNGATVDTLTITKLKSAQVQVPPPPEQKRIVAILDEAFAGIDTAIANTEKNLANARELFESYLNSVFTQKGDGWKEVTIGDIAQVKGGKRVPKGYKLQTEPTKHPYISVSDFNDFGGVVLDKIKFISEEVYQQISRYTISSKDLYISIAGTIGKSGIIPKELEGANLTENACKLVLDKDVSNQYLYFFTRTESFKEQALKNTRTAAQPKLALERLKTISLSIPPFEMQEGLVGQFNDLWSQSQDLESIYQQKLTALAELKQSLLQKAFSGELTADAGEAVDKAEAALA